MVGISGNLLKVISADLFGIAVRLFLSLLIVQYLWSVSVMQWWSCCCCWWPCLLGWWEPAQSVVPPTCPALQQWGCSGTPAINLFTRSATGSVPGTTASRYAATYWALMMWCMGYTGAMYWPCISVCVLPYAGLQGYKNMPAAYPGLKLYACFPPSRNVTCRNVSILSFAKTYVKILRNVRYFYVLLKWYVKILT